MQPKKVDVYKILKNYCEKDLEDEVSDLIANGYQPYGGTQVLAVTPPRNIRSAVSVINSGDNNAFLEDAKEMIDKLKASEKDTSDPALPDCEDLCLFPLFVQTMVRYDH